MILVIAGCASAQPCAYVCPTADDVAVQQQLDATAAAGGGTVQLEARVYATCSPYVVGSNTHFRGAGRGATIIRGGPVLIKPLVQGVYPGASIATVAANNVTISDLTVDHATCNRRSGGIELLMSDSIHSLNVSTNVLVENTEVIGSGDPTHHAYMIWNFKGRGVKIVNNWVDGRMSAASSQEGIESFGGHDVLISGNTIQNIGFAGVNLGSADAAYSETDGIVVENNHITDSGMGINLGTSNATQGPQNSYAMRMIGNTIIGARVTGINIAAAPGTEMRDITISKNTIRDMNGSGVAGISMQTTSGTSTVVANAIEGNHVENIRGANSYGIRITNYANVRVLGNTITGVDGGAVLTTNANDTEIAGNKIRDGGASAIQMIGTFARFAIKDNPLHWGGTSAAISVAGGQLGTIRDNIFTRPDTAQPAAITIGTGTCSVTITGNEPWYWPTWPGVSAPACP